jgi:AraC-like DNA-binding protein
MFQVEKAYRNGKMSLDSLSERLGLKSYQLSGIINNRFGNSFTEFVADYRLEEVKKRLGDPAETASILNIAYDAGFGTKASFNRTFKERTGLTPSEFRKKPPGK